ncbi:MAG: hypothetical protein PVH68_03905 [Armatimonadota bacterium]|jgi:hypothetical protein
MKPWTISSMLIITLCAPASELAAENLVINGGFEEVGEEGGPAGWSFEGAARMAMGAAGLVPRAHSGKTALALTSSFQLVDSFAYSNSFELGDRRELLVTFHYRTRRTPRATVALATLHEPIRESLRDRPPVQLEFQALAPAKPWQHASARFHLSPVARHAVLLFRIRGEGALMVDDVTVARYPDRLAAELLLPGIVARLPNKRLARARVRNLGQFRTRGAAELTVTPRRGAAQRHSAPFDLPPGGEALIDVPYSLDAKQAHEAALAFYDSTGQSVLERLVFEAPALLDVEPLVPAFRATVLSSLRPEICRARCRVNALDTVAQSIEITCTLRTASEDRADLRVSVTRGAADTEWELQAPLDGLAPGRYELEVTARAGGRRILTTSTPLWVLEPRRWEVGHDEHGVLHLSGHPLFPICMLGIESGAILKDLAAAGLNCVVTPGDAVRLDLLDEAHLRGLKVIVVMQPPTTAALSGAVQRLATHPALLAWYVPGAPGQTAAEVAATVDLQQHLASWDPYHPVIGLLTAGWPSARQRMSADVFITASRPFTYWPLASLAECLDEARRASKGPTASWAAVQTDGLAWRVGEGLSKTGEGRPPTPDELRCLVYLAIVHGARGILYTAYHSPSRSGVPELFLPRDCPELWAAVVQTNKELRDLAPALLSPAGARRFEAQPAAVHAALVGEGRDQVLIAVNPTAEALELRLRLPTALAAAVRPYSTDDPPAEIDGGALHGTLPAHAVRIFRAPE